MYLTVSWPSPSKTAQTAKVWYSKEEKKTSSSHAVGAAFAILVGLAVVASCCLSWFQ